MALAIPGTYLIMESNNFVPFPIIDVGFSFPANIVFMERFLRYNYAIVYNISGLSLMKKSNPGSTNLLSWMWSLRASSKNYNDDCESVPEVFLFSNNAWRNAISGVLPADC